MATKTYNEVVLEDAPRFFSNTDEASGNFTDDTRFGHDMVVEDAPTFSQSMASGITGALYDGSNDMHVIAQTAEYDDLSYPFTMECWFKSPASTSANTTYAAMMLNSDESGGAAIWYSLLYLATDGSNNLVAKVQTKDASATTLDADTTVLNKNETYHVVCVFNANNDRDLYINGTLVQNFTTARTSLNAAQKNRVSIGGFRYNNGASAVFYNGTNGCPAVYNYALSAERIRIHQAVGRGFTNDESYGYQCMRRAPTLFWQTDETSGTTIADASGWSHDGTSAGTPTLNQAGPGTQKVISFDGVDDKVALDGATAVDVVVPGPYPYTDIVWMKTPASTSASTVYCRSGIFNDGAADQFFSCYMQTNAGNDAVTVVFQARNTTAFNVTVTDVAEINTYVMIAAVYTSATDRKYYINGELVGSDTNSVTFPTGADSIDIGVYDVTSGPFFSSGFIGLRSIHPTALTADDIREMRVAGLNQLSNSEANVHLEDAPSAYLLLDETSGTTAADSSPWGRDFTYAGSPTLSANGVTFDGSAGQEGQIARSLELDAYPVTITTRVKSPASTSSSLFYGITSVGDTGGTTNFIYVGLATDGSNNLFAKARMRSGGTDRDCDGPAVLVKDQYYTLHFVLRSATDRELYVNGVSVATETTSTTFPTGLDSTGIGTIPASVNLNYAGTHQRAAFYNRELSEAEIREQVVSAQGNFAPHSTSLANQILAHAPNAYIALDETSGTTAADSSPFANDFTHAGSPTLSATGVTYDGVDDETTPTTEFAANTAYPFTISGILTSPGSTSSSTNYALIGIGDTAGNNNYVYCGLVTNGSNELYARTGINSGGTSSEAASAAVLVKGRQYFVHSVFESSTSRKVYVNGVLMDTDTTSLAWPSGLDATSIGKLPRSSSIFTSGDIYQAKFHLGKAMTIAEVQAEVAAWQGNTKQYGRAVHSFSPVGYWRCNEGSGTTFADVSGWGNDLTVAGSPTLNGAGPLYNDTDSGAIGDGDATDDAAAGALTIPTPAYPFAISGWVKSPASTSASTAYARMVIGDDGVGSNTIGCDLLADGSNSHLEARHLFTTGATSDHVTSTKPAERGVFHHVLFVCRSATDREMYVNGSSETTDATSHTIGTGLDDAVFLRGTGASPPFFAGTIGEVSFHNHSFTDADALELYLAGSEAQVSALVPMGTINETGTLDNIVGTDVAKFVSTDRSGELSNIVMPEHAKAVSSRQVVTIATSCGIIMEGRASVAFVVARTAEGEMSIIMDFDHAASFHGSKSGDLGIIVEPDHTKTVNVDPGSTAATPVTPRYKFTPGRQAYIFTPPREGNDNEV